VPKGAPTVGVRAANGLHPMKARPSRHGIGHSIYRAYPPSHRPAMASGMAESVVCVPGPPLRPLNFSPRENSTARPKAEVQMRPAGQSPHAAGTANSAYDSANSPCNDTTPHPHNHPQLVLSTDYCGTPACDVCDPPLTGQTAQQLYSLAVLASHNLLTYSMALPR
jgi:hypothetical protein